MMNQKVLLLIVSVLFVFVAGCGEETTPPVPQKKPKAVEAPIPKPGTVAAESVTEKETEPVYQYDPSGRRDPFKVLIEVRSPIVVSDEPLTPLQQVDLGQLRLIGVIEGKGEAMAMVAAPGGKSYILKKGVKVGRNNGVVVGVDSEGVSVQEKYYDFAGDVRASIQKIELPSREGAN